jgi:AcrR family transcriptional regulator
VTRHRADRVTHPPRQPQAERAERMRARLLDATIDCLATTGYGRMSTNDVVRQARVSRGALAHHYPTKADLVKAAAQRLLDQRAIEFRDRFTAIDPERRTPAEALDVLWSFYEDPSGMALLELTVAARSHPELQAVLGPVSDQLATNTALVFVEFFPDLAQLPVAEQALRTIHAAFGGLALASLANRDDDHIQQVRDFLKLLVSHTDRLSPLLTEPAASHRSQL